MNQHLLCSSPSFAASATTCIQRETRMSQQLLCSSPSFAVSAATHIQVGDKNESAAPVFFSKTPSTAPGAQPWMSASRFLSLGSGLWHNCQGVWQFHHHSSFTASASTCIQRETRMIQQLLCSSPSFAASAATSIQRETRMSQHLLCSSPSFAASAATCIQMETRMSQQLLCSSPRFFFFLVIVLEHGIIYVLFLSSTFTFTSATATSIEVGDKNESAAPVFISKTFDAFGVGEMKSCTITHSTAKPAKHLERPYLYILALFPK
ncbi:uncharacterized protein LOC143269826 [Peromyscus maniculatus bairdii]|uniref:uncharacterized protein LOC143269826 n=1 Tax=Peromyscus maniculatus bairdii TaxID=230844 RepID=UPI003FD522D9